MKICYEQDLAIRAERERREKERVKRPVNYKNIPAEIGTLKDLEYTSY
jgi:hypothetical protein